MQGVNNAIAHLIVRAFLLRYEIACYIGVMSENSRLISKKEEWARMGRGLLEDGVMRDTRQRSRRLPPGQHVAKGWPVLDLGIHPTIALSDFTLTITGCVEQPVVWDWDTLLKHPQKKSISDFHCVTTWSTFDNEWEGVMFSHLLETVKLKSEAAYVFFTSGDNYSTNLPLSVCLDDDVLLARSWNGQPLSVEHGGPLRMIVPKVYAWKGAKWVKEIIFMERDRLGYWEKRGYSNTADPWMDDRYSL